MSVAVLLLRLVPPSVEGRRWWASSTFCRRFIANSRYYFYSYLFPGDPFLSIGAGKKCYNYDSNRSNGSSYNVANATGQSLAKIFRAGLLEYRVQLLLGFLLLLELLLPGLLLLFFFGVAHCVIVLLIVAVLDPLEVFGPSGALSGFTGGELRSPVFMMKPDDVPQTTKDLQETIKSAD